MQSKNSKNKNKKNKNKNKIKNPKKRSFGIYTSLGYFIQFNSQSMGRPDKRKPA